MNKEKNIHPIGFFICNDWIDQNIPVTVISKMSLLLIANENSFIHPVKSVFFQLFYHNYPIEIFGLNPQETE